jgi:hypothetical protein
MWLDRPARPILVAYVEPKLFFGLLSKKILDCSPYTIKTSLWVLLPLFARERRPSSERASPLLR